MEKLAKVDILRWLAILLMIFFHLNYSLLNIFHIQILNFSELFWFVLWKVSALLFIFIAWVSFFLSSKKYWKSIAKKYTKKAVYLWIIAWIISLITYFWFDSKFYIRFWIIHFFALSFLLMIVFRRFRYYNLLFWTIIIVYGVYFIPIIENKNLYFLWFRYYWFKSGDYYPILPYFWVMLLWYVFALFLSDTNKLNLLKLKNNSNILLKILELFWKKSLLIYLIHQPIIVFIIYCIKLL